ncbi:OmpA family protein [Hymenobacter sp. B81]|uniref:OmpA family protein n=1 Tax=Hymenobacter sp. B81 TaxID=3344878 RepID=UPI0037DD9E93
MPHFYATRFVLTLTLAGSALAARAQGSTNLSGSVQSADRQSVPKAAVTVLHEPTGFIRATTTGPAGEFTLPALPPGGPYLVQVSQPGYKQQVKSNVYLSAGQPNTLAFVLDRSGAARPAAPDATAGATASAAGEPPRTYRYQRKPPPKLAPATGGHYDAASGNYIYETGPLVSLKLPGGGVLAGVGAKSTESLLHQFLNNPQARVDTVDLTQGWINFDRVFFDPGKASITRESAPQLRHIAALLRAYPAARIKIGGYSDSTGTYKVNKQLSEARARTAWAALVELGVSPARLEARGYGPRYALASNATEEGRAMNRRLSIKVLAK